MGAYVELRNRGDRPTPILTPDSRILKAEEIRDVFQDTSAHRRERSLDQVGEVIFRQAREYQAELIICGTHGRRGVRRLLMGSDAEYIMRRSPAPVLLVRTPGTA